MLGKIVLGFWVAFGVLMILFQTFILLWILEEATK